MKKKNWLCVILFLALFAYYFLVPMNIFWDTGHYMSFVSIFEGTLPWSSWDIVRGVVFPLILHLSNIIFGKTTQGILFLSFTFYLIMLMIVKFILDKSLVDVKPKYKKIIYILLFAYIILDPIIYGYYHALLTEFVAITISLLMCYMSFKWMNINFSDNRKKYILYSILFVSGTIFSWHLKQPYVTITLFPVILASFVSLVKKISLKNFIQRGSTVLLCIVGLVASIFLWNQFLQSKGINLNTDRNVTASFGKQLLTGLNNYEIVTNLTIDYVNDSNFLSKSEKKKLQDNPNNYYLLNINSGRGKTIDQTIIKLNNSNNPSTLTTASFIIKQIFEHPYLVFESYFSNYLAIANLYSKNTNDGVSYWVEKDFSLNYCHENCSIAVSVASNKSNISYMLPDAYNRVVNYEQYNDSPIVIRYLLKGISYITTNIFKVVLLILPLLSILSLVSLVRKKDSKYYKLLSMIFILSWYSLLHILVHVVTGANIDRYASPAYITSILALVLYIYYFIKSKRVRVKK